MPFEFSLFGGSLHDSDSLACNVCVTSHKAGVNVCGMNVRIDEFGLRAEGGILKHSLRSRVCVCVCVCVCVPFHKNLRDELKISTY